jgi:ASC-1-like (ASCH) protein
MQHEMKLFIDLAFKAVKSGDKIVELCLCDPKRARLKLGDEILFTSKNGDTVLVKIIGLCHFANFHELFKVIPPVLGGFEPNDSAEDAVERMYSIYSADEIKKYGVLGIIIRKI